jgi:hypothetical protein
MKNHLSHFVETAAIKTSVGVGGTLATVGLESVSEFVSIFVGLATIAYMAISIAKVIKKWHD